MEILSFTTRTLKSFPAHRTQFEVSLLVKLVLNVIPVESLIGVMCDSIHGPLLLLYR